MTIHDLAVIITGFLTLIVLFMTHINTRRLKVADVISDNYRRFDLLLSERARLVELEANTKTREKQIKLFYIRFWNLQSDQFNFWLQGLIPERNYLSWLKVRQQEYELDVEIAPDTSFRKGWDMVKKDHEEEFQKFMESVFEKGPQKTLEDKKWRPKRITLYLNTGSAKILAGYPLNAGQFKSFIRRMIKPKE